MALVLLLPGDAPAVHRDQLCARDMVSCEAALCHDVIDGLHLRDVAHRPLWSNLDLILELARWSV